MHALPYWNDVSRGFVGVHDISQLQRGDLFVGIDLQELRSGHVFLRRCDHMHDLPCWNNVFLGRHVLHDIKQLQRGKLPVGIILRDLQHGYVFYRRCEYVLQLPTWNLHLGHGNFCMHCLHGGNL